MNVESWYEEEFYSNEFSDIQRVLGISILLGTGVAFLFLLPSMPWMAELGVIRQDSFLKVSCRPCHTAP
ncbi:MAG: hypothetical protein K2N55_02295, partial [Lachnospiraceae bacterium]|nr:hypothetical protein [Lachnospiraceae bacterium]